MIHSSFNQKQWHGILIPYRGRYLQTLYPYKLQVELDEYLLKLTDHWRQHIGKYAWENLLVTGRQIPNTPVIEVKDIKLVPEIEDVPILPKLDDYEEFSTWKPQPNHYFISA